MVSNDAANRQPISGIRCGCPGLPGGRTSTSYRLLFGSAAASVAAILSRVVEARDKTVAVLSGGNIDLLLLDTLIRHGLESRGRFASLSVVVPDEPGHLAQVLARVGSHGESVP